MESRVRHYLITSAMTKGANGRHPLHNGKSPLFILLFVRLNRMHMQVKGVRDYSLPVICDLRHATHLSTTFLAKNAPSPRAVYTCTSAHINIYIHRGLCVLTSFVGEGADCLLTRI
jgi:hypothetical protein